MYCLLYSKLNDASIKQTAITLTFSGSLNGITGYKFTLGIPFAGYINRGLIGWIGIYKQNSMYYIYGFYAATYKGGGAIEDFCIISNSTATIFYI